MNKDKKYIFLHVPKVAGTSIASTLPDQKWHNGPFADAYHPFKNRHQWRPPSTWPNLDENTGKVIKEAGKNLSDTIDKRYYTDRIYHLTLEQMLEVGLLSAEEFDKYFSFCFVRNPWDRLISIWLSMAKGAYEIARETTGKVGEKELEYFLNNNKIMSTEIFCRKFIMGELKNLTKLAGKWYYPRYYSVVINNIELQTSPENYRFLTPDADTSSIPRTHLRKSSYGANWLVPQSLYTQCKKSGKKVDFIGRYENLENDFKVVAEEIGIIKDACLPHINSTKKALTLDYTKYYTKEAREMIAEIYAEDIKMFGYKFGE